jgi:hypothetical protein
VADAPAKASDRPDHVPLLIAGLVMLAGGSAAIHYAHAGLALSHYDARAHLVVARRIFDSLLPGWQQIGAVWLPLPHLLNMVPVQVDAWYRSGASAIAISVISMAVGAWALASILRRTTGSVVGALIGASLLMLNPNVLYLQSTPMTEPLLFGTTLLAIALTTDWIDRGATAAPTSAGLALTAAFMTRYEAWPITAAIVALSGLTLVRRGAGPWRASTACARLALYPAIAGFVFLVNSRWTVGPWFISAGFFVPENKALGDGFLAWQQVREGVYLLSGSALVWSAYASATLVAIAFFTSSSRASLIVLFAPAAAALLPWYAYLQGHPLRVRYSLPLIAACASLVAAGVALLPRRTRLPAAVAIVIFTSVQAHPLDRAAPLIVESQRDAQNRIGRRVVSEYLSRHRDGTPILMSMGSLAHYMHDLSAYGFAIHDFLHEGNGELWVAALQFGPRGLVRWVVVEEQAEGGDALFLRAKRDPHFFDGFARVAEGGGVVVYQRIFN